MLRLVVHWGCTCNNFSDDLGIYLELNANQNDWVQRTHHLILAALGTREKVIMVDKCFIHCTPILDKVCNQNKQKSSHDTRRISIGCDVIMMTITTDNATT